MILYVPTRDGRRRERRASGPRVAFYALQCLAQREIQAHSTEQTVRPVRHGRDPVVGETLSRPPDRRIAMVELQMAGLVGALEPAEEEPCGEPE